MLIGRLSVLGIVLSGVVHADTFSVQIGAFRNPEVVRIELPADVGKLRSIAGSDGLTRFVVGTFSSRTEAEGVLDELRAAGFGDAFVRAMADISNTAPITASTHKADSDATQAPAHDNHDASTISRRDLDILMSLTEEERRDVVYLDGRLHKKVGDEFLPIRD